MLCPVPLHQILPKREMSEKPKFHCLVADTTAFIQNVNFLVRSIIPPQKPDRTFPKTTSLSLSHSPYPQNYADFVITVPEVINEIKNRRQLKRLCVLPYELTVDEPSPESVRHVIEFAKKTGDYLSLSSADIKVIALTYQLEKELVGTAHLRTDPVQAKTIASRDKPAELIDRAPVAGFYNPPTKEQLQEKEFETHGLDLGTVVKELDLEAVERAQRAEEEGPEVGEGADDEDDDAEYDEEDEEQAKELAESVAALDLSKDDEKFNAILAPVKATDAGKEKADEAKSDDDGGEDDDDADASSECTESDGDETDLTSWITPGNLVEVKSLYGKDAAEEQSVRVACMSTDYAIQNVLKQINLHIAALDGRIIRNMRTYILRCYACFKTTSLMTKMFCPNCGHKTLKRVAVSLDENGQQVIHINLRRPLTGKGKNQSIPRPRGGKHSSNPILFEDQPIPKQMPSRVARTKTQAMDEDYVAGFSPFVRRDVDSKSALLRAKSGTTSLKQWARNNEFNNLKRRQKK